MNSNRPEFRSKKRAARCRHRAMQILRMTGYWSQKYADFSKRASNHRLCGRLCLVRRLEKEI